MRALFFLGPTLNKNRDVPLGYRVLDRLAVTARCAPPFAKAGLWGVKAIAAVQAGYLGLYDALEKGTLFSVVSKPTDASPVVRAWRGEREGYALNVHGAPKG